MSIANTKPKKKTLTLTLTQEPLQGLFTGNRRDQALGRMLEEPGTLATRFEAFSLRSGVAVMREGIRHFVRF